MDYLNYMEELSIGWENTFKIWADLNLILMLRKVHIMHKGAMRSSLNWNFSLEELKNLIALT